MNVRRRASGPVNRECAQRLHARESTVRDLIASDAALPAVADAVASILDDLVDRAMGCVMLVDEDGTTLSPLGHAALPAAFAATLQKMPIGPRSPTCGACAYQHQPSVSVDMNRDPSWEQRRWSIRKFGLAACWSTPVIDPWSGQVLGTVAVYRRVRGRPSATDLHVMTACSTLVFGAIDRAQAAAQHAERSGTDALTGLPDRSIFVRALGEYLDAPGRGETPTMLLVDLDGFGVINEGVGRELGDSILKTVGRRLTAAFPPPAVVARLDNDEFACLLPETSQKSAISVAEDLLGVFEDPVAMEDGELFLNGSVGVAVAGPDLIGPGELVQHADAALLRAKELGRGHAVVYDEQLRLSVPDRLAVEDGLREAFERDQFVVLFQPQFAVNGFIPAGVESLIRWRHPQWGVIGPGRFIHAAEEAGLIWPLTEVVLDAACRLTWSLAQASTAPVVPVWVNLSASQLGDPSLVPSATRVLDRHGLEGSRIGFEVTEGAFLRDLEAGTRNLHKLKELGFWLGIDDFGTGGSTPGRLRQLPVDVVKVDNSFLARLGQNPHQDQIVATFVDTVDTLGMRSLAVGVETLEQLRVLSKLGCDLVQGFLFARPAPANEIIDLAGLGIMN